MTAPNIPQEWKQLCHSENADVLHECIDSVFRRLLANLLLHFENPKFRQVQKDNKALHRLTSSLPADFIKYLFACLDFEDEGGSYCFKGNQESLKHADAVYSQLEALIDKEKLDAAERDVHQMKLLAAKRAATQSSSPAHSPPIPAAPAKSSERDEKASKEKVLFEQEEGTRKDLEEGKLVEEAVRKTLLNTGRVRNSFFEAKDLTIRTMRHGRVYACTEKCGNECLEVHWHLLTGKNILYSHLAHLSADGTRLLHLGLEHGYQYNSLPGSQHFGKMIHFSEKLTDEHGKLIQLKHDDRPVASCIYCGRPFSELLL